MYVSQSALRKTRVAMVRTLHMNLINFCSTHTHTHTHTTAKYRQTCCQSTWQTHRTQQQILPSALYYSHYSI